MGFRFRMRVYMIILIWCFLFVVVVRKVGMSGTLPSYEVHSQGNMSPMFTGCEFLCLYMLKNELSGCFFFGNEMSSVVKREAELCIP